jgi:hypothetical protein
MNVQNSANSAGPHKTTVAVATLMVVKLAVREWLHCTAWCPDGYRTQHALQILIDAFK